MVFDVVKVPIRRPRLATEPDPLTGVTWAWVARNLPSPAKRRVPAPATQPSWRAEGGCTGARTVADSSRTNGGVVLKGSERYNDRSGPGARGRSVLLGGELDVLRRCDPAATTPIKPTIDRRVDRFLRCH